VDADAVRAFRPQLKVRVPKHARWFAIGAVVLVALALLLTQRRAPQGGAGSVELAATAPALMPHARAAELPAKPSEPAPPAEPAAPPDEVASARELMHGEAAEAPVGHANRANARKASLLSNQGNAFRRKKMLPSARVRYLEALRVYPDYPRALSGLVQLALNGGDKGEALRYAKQLVKARPGQAVYQLLLGDAYRATGDEKEARKSYQSAAQLGSKDAEARLAK
jgi:tetratricopeptide (TPR) repeat protein